MNKFATLRTNVPVLQVKQGAREVIIKVVSSMCDNVHFFHFKKNAEGDFKLSTYNSHNIRMAFSNYQTKVTRQDLEWDADDENWSAVVNGINSGVQAVESARSR